MKKIICLISTFILLLSAFGLVAYASEPQVAFSDSFDSLSYGGTEYIAIDSSNISINDYQGIINISLTDEQKDKVRSLDLTCYGSERFIAATYKLNSGAELICTYIDKEYYPEYEKALNRETEKVFMNMYSSISEKYALELPKLMETTTTYNYDSFMGVDNWFPVYSAFSESDAWMYIGVIIDDNDKYYYMDFDVVGIEDSYNFDFWNLENTKLNVYEITNAEQAKLIEEYIEYYSYDDVGSIFFGDDDASTIISNVLLVLIFGILPLAVFVGSLILGIKSKPKYRKLFFSLTVIAAVEIIVFTVLFVTLLL